LLFCDKLIIFAPAKREMDSGPSSIRLQRTGPTFAEAAVDGALLRQGYGVQGEIAQLVRAHDS
jgi:hypothetical protein